MLHRRGRTLSVLEQEGEAPRLARESGSTRHEVADALHHDHIIDLDTGLIAERRSKKIEGQREITAQHGDDIVQHRRELYCRKRT